MGMSIGIGFMAVGAVKRRPGRPQKLRASEVLTLIPARKGRPAKYSSEHVTWLVHRIDEVRATASKEGRPICDEEALIAELKAYHHKKAREHGLSLLRANGATAKRLPALKMLLSRARRKR